MFSGIVQALATVDSLHQEHALISISLIFPLEQLAGLQPGASVAVNGVCLTATTITPPRVHFDIMRETRQRTTLAQLRVGERVHIERSLRYGEEIGGHPVYGHVHTTGEVVAAHFAPGETFLQIRVPPQYHRFLVEKGFVSLHGVSLTVNSPDRERSVFRVDLIPETLRRTIFAQCRPGTLLNVEFDPQLVQRVDSNTV